MEEALSKIIDTLSNLNLPSPVVDRPTLESAVTECNDAAQPDSSTDKVGSVCDISLEVVSLLHLVASCW